MSTIEIHAEHSVTEHEHGSDCGHEAVQHDGHVDYVHGTHHHEHESVAEHSVDAHTHGADCGHETVEHDGHIDYLHDGHKHAEHGSHYDEH